LPNRREPPLWRFFFAQHFEGHPMQIITIKQAPYCVPPRPRLLIAKASTVWLWPGIPLTELRGSTVRPISPDAMRFWLSKFMGPEIVGQPVPSHVGSAAEHLSQGDEAEAQRCLDRAAGESFSAEGAMLAQVVAARLGIHVPDMPIAKRMPRWDRNFISSQAPSFDRFAAAADWLDKAGTFNPDEHDRWDAGSKEGKPGAFKPMNKPQPAVSRARRPDSPGPSTGDNVNGQNHNGAGVQQIGDHDSCME
jgi:hypothetical protein